ncbi:MAG TPA: hypothetical protein VF039_06955 [Longimicrobiales bacterium]
MTRATVRSTAVAVLGLVAWGWLAAWTYCPHDAAPVASDSAAHERAHAHAGTAAPARTSEHDDAEREPAPTPPAGPQCPVATLSPAGCTMTAQVTRPTALVPLSETYATVAWPPVVLHSRIARSSIFRPPIG